jgi:hypothetical protein
VKIGFDWKIATITTLLFLFILFVVPLWAYYWVPIFNDYPPIPKVLLSSLPMLILFFMFVGIKTGGK